jgi:endonuclease YncB( thermonuclease family)
MKNFLSMVLFLLGLLVTNANASFVLQGLVIGVSDGDSITVLDSDKRQHKIRLQGIDAPEKAQAYGQKSKESLSKLVYKKTVQVLLSKKDRFGRTVGQVMIGEIDVCLEQVRRGMAWHYKDYQGEQSIEDRVLYDRAETQARERRSGLWQDPAPMEPSLFRRQR